MLSRSALGALAGVSLVFAPLLAACIGDDSTGTPPNVEPVDQISIDAGPTGTADADHPAPETTLGDTPPALTNQKTARFTFSADRASTFSCRVDTGAPQTCTSPFSIDVTEGEHTFAVTATSTEGTPDLSPATYTWTVDLTPPTTVITKRPPALDNAKTVDFEFSANEAATFQCTMDGAAATACTSPLSVGGLGDGTHTFTVTATDKAGNVEAAPPSYSWKIDTTIPDTAINSGPTGSVSSKTASITFSSPNVTGATFECALDAAAFAACTSPVSLTALAEGAHTFQVRAKNTLGTVDPSPASRAWTVDTIAPTLTVAGPLGLTNTKTPQWTFTSTGATKIECRMDANAFAVCASPYTSASLTEGAHALQVRASDAANNMLTVTRNITVDTTPPTVTVTNGPTSTAYAQDTFYFTAEAGSTTTCRIYPQGSPSGAYSACASPYTTNMPAPTGGALSENWTFEVLAQDAAGNTAVSNPWNFSTYIIP